MGIKSFLKGLATGAVVGTAAGLATGLLSAPKSGKKLQAEIMEYSEDMRKDIMKMLTRAEKVTKEVYEDTVNKVIDTYNQAKEMSTEEIDMVRTMLMKEWKAIAAKISKVTAK